MSTAQHRIELCCSLESRMCPACSGPKRRAQSFCQACYFRLPKQTRSDLYKRIGHGYEEVHAEAMSILQGKAKD